MTIKVKICGLKTIKQVKESINGKAKMIGLMFYKKSPRFINIKTAQKFIKKEFTLFTKSYLLFLIFFSFKFLIASL